MSFIKREIDWLHEHARRDDDGAWWCKKTGKAIQTAVVGRSIHLAGMPLAGSGEVRSVVHIACAGCDPNKEPPRYGTPINESELVENV